MSESTTDTAESAPAAEGKDFEPITSQEDFEKRIGARLAREAKKYADYQDLKSKAAKLDELEAKTAESNKTWEQKYRELEGQLTAKEKQITRIEVAAAKGLPANQAHRLKGDTREEIEADAEELLTLISKQERPKMPPSGLKSGASGTDSRMDPKERAAAALRSFRRT